jgi:pimeloyl-ACP methyl ester carboxylesterase
MATLESRAPVSRLREIVATLTLWSPFWERSRAHRIGRLLLRLTYLYALLLVVLMCLEDWFLFHASQRSDWHPLPAEYAAQDVFLTSADGTPIHAWWVTPDGWQPRQGAMLLCHGNGGNLSYGSPSAQYWVRRHRTAVLLFDYPGYGKSGGKPSEAGCYAAADACCDFLTGEQKVPAYRLLLYGGSLGGAVAVDVASRRPHRALVLVSTFTTFPDMAQKQFPLTPARWLARNRFDSLAKIQRVSGPVFVTHSTGDTLIPFAMGQRLFEAAPGPKEFFTMHEHRHDDLGCHEAFEALEVFLKKHAP